MQVSEEVKTAYANQYDQSIIEWRTIAAKYKAKNIVALAKDIKFDSVLEVGCGEGSILHWLSEWDFSKNICAVEISESGIEIVKSKKIKNLKEVLLFDGYKIPYPDNHFDLVVCSHVLEHVEHERVLLREIKRVSKYQIFEVPIDFSFYVDKKLNHFLAYGHINIYTPGLLRFLLLSENFKLKKDILVIYPDEVLNRSLKGMALYKARFKNRILKLFPYFLGVKPNAYTVLTEKQEKDLAIM
ncbi:MAG TPA: class I SAM-dependent methyltransferase [Bacteroidia bacterium]|nr:class I SAM-dependent methyltransferase [Bacteroidia bacterium]